MDAARSTSSSAGNRPRCPRRASPSLRQLRRGLLERGRGRSLAGDASRRGAGRCAGRSSRIHCGVTRPSPAQPQSRSTCSRSRVNLPIRPPSRISRLKHGWQRSPSPATEIESNDPSALPHAPHLLPWLMSTSSSKASRRHVRARLLGHRIDRRRGRRHDPEPVTRWRRLIETNGGA